MSDEFARSLAGDLISPNNGVIRNLDRFAPPDEDLETVTLLRAQFFSTGVGGTDGRGVGYGLAAEGVSIAKAFAKVRACLCEPHAPVFPPTQQCAKANGGELCPC